MSENLDNLRAELRAWLGANAPRDWRETATHEAFVAGQRAWFAQLAGAGYAIPHWPAEWPGGGRSLAAQKVIYEELARARVVGKTRQAPSLAGGMLYLRDDKEIVALSVRKEKTVGCISGSAMHLHNGRSIPQVHGATADAPYLNDLRSA